MQKINITYWIVTGLLSAFIVLGAFIDLSKSADAVALVHHLGYPEYLLPFIGTLKILAIVTIVQPSLPKLKEWAYAGLVFDVSGALFSHLSSNDTADQWLPALLTLVFIAGSYILYRMLNRFRKI